VTLDLNLKISANQHYEKCFQWSSVWVLTALWITNLQWALLSVNLSVLSSSHLSTIWYFLTMLSLVFLISSFLIRYLMMSFSKHDMTKKADTILLINFLCQPFPEPIYLFLLLSDSNRSICWQQLVVNMVLSVHKSTGVLCTDELSMTLLSNTSSHTEQLQHRHAMNI